MNQTVIMPAAVVTEASPRASPRRTHSSFPGEEPAVAEGRQGRCSGGSPRSAGCPYKCLCPHAGTCGCLRGGQCKRQRCSSTAPSEEVIDLDMGWAVSDCAVPLLVPCSCNHMSVVGLKSLTHGMGNIFPFPLFV